MLLCKRSNLAIIVAVATLAATPAAAQQRGDVPSGHMLILRDVAPRNAVVPGTGEALTVRVAPDPRIFGIVPDTLRILDDESASGVTGGRPGGVSISGLVGLGLGSEVGAMSGGAASSEAGRGGGGIGQTIGGTIGIGMGALRGALGSIRGGSGQ